MPSRSQSDCLTVYQVSPFASIPESFWFTIVALMAVGYGDVYPVLASFSFAQSAFALGATGAAA